MDSPSGGTGSGPISPKVEPGNIKFKRKSHRDPSVFLKDSLSFTSDDVSESFSLKSPLTISGATTAHTTINDSLQSPTSPNVKPTTFLN